MKTVTSDQDIYESEIKPKELFDEFRRLTSLEVQANLADPGKLISIGCPGCKSLEFNVAFVKMGLTFCECTKCKSVYVSPRPSENAVVDFYRNSSSSRFWRENIFPATKEIRRKKIFRPRAEWLLNAVDQYAKDPREGISIGYHSDLLIQELKSQEENLFHITVANPLADIEFEEFDFNNVEIQPIRVEKINERHSADLVMAFDILDRCVDVEKLFSAIHAVLIPGGLMLASTTLITGFDFQVLWDRSRDINLPDRLNLFSVEGLAALIKRSGFQVLEFSTPGIFDVDIVQRAISDDPDGDWPRFFSYLTKYRGIEALREFQEYLQSHRLSSYARLILLKPS